MVCLIIPTHTIRAALFVNYIYIGQLTDSDFEEKVEEFLKHSSTSPENVQDGNERISSPPTRIHHGTGQSIK